MFGYWCIDSLTGAEMNLLFSEAVKSPDSPDISFSAAASGAGVDYLRGWRYETLSNKGLRGLRSLNPSARQA